MDVWKRGICWAATATTLIGYLYSVAARRFNFPSLAPISIDRLKGAAALAFVLTIVYESDGVKTFARTAVMEAYHDEHYHYPIIMLGALAIWFCTMKPIQGRKGFLNQHQTEEVKGLLQIWFVGRHYVGARWAQKAGRSFVGSFLFLSGYGITLSLMKNKSLKYSWNEYALRVFWVLWRLNFFTLFCMALLEVPYMGYFYIPLATFWTVTTFTILYICRCFSLTKKQITLVLLGCLGVALMWTMFPFLVEILFTPLAPIFSLDGSLHEWAFRLTLDPFGCLCGALCALYRKKVVKFLEAWERKYIISHRICCVLAVFSIAAFIFILSNPVVPKEVYYKWHPYTSIPVILVIFLVRNFSAPFREMYSPLFKFLGTLSLELYLVQYHVLLCEHATQILVLLEGANWFVNAVFTSLVYVALSWLTQQATVALFPIVSSKDKQ